uniref:Nucleolar protein n=1 Tax=Amorphochlora amoebiformis TaxID=1561963 RepID=A0A0H5BR04_9EUKA|nr:nucleolar protein [Amorphochlora amoebiformis]
MIILIQNLIGVGIFKLYKNATGRRIKCIKFLYYKCIKSIIKFNNLIIKIPSEELNIGKSSCSYISYNQAKLQKILYRKNKRLSFLPKLHNGLLYCDILAQKYIKNILSKCNNIWQNQNTCHQNTFCLDHYILPKMNLNHYSFFSHKINQEMLINIEILKETLEFHSLFIHKRLEPSYNSLISNNFFKLETLSSFISLTKNKKINNELFKNIFFQVKSSMKFCNYIKKDIIFKIFSMYPNFYQLMGFLSSINYIYIAKGLFNLTKLSSNTLQNMNEVLVYSNIYFNLTKRKKKILYNHYLTKQISMRSKNKVLKLIAFKSNLCGRIDLYNAYRINHFGLNIKGQVFHLIQIENIIHRVES